MRTHSSDLLKCMQFLLIQPSCSFKMARNDGDFMGELLTNVELEVMTSLRNFRKANQCFDANFKKAFLQALDSR